MSCSSDSILVIISSPPSLDLEASELVLALAAFDLPVTLVFVGLGTHWLYTQNARKSGGKSAHKVLAALPIYGVEQVFCLKNDLALHGVEESSLPNFVHLLDQAQYQQQLAQSQHCFTF